MITDESQITKEKTETGEIWTTPWRYSRVEAYVDLSDCSQFMHDYLASQNWELEPFTTIEDDDEHSRHRAVCTLTFSASASSAPPAPQSTSPPSETSPGSTSGQ